MHAHNTRGTSLLCMLYLPTAAGMADAPVVRDGIGSLEDDVVADALAVCSGIGSLEDDVPAVASERREAIRRSIQACCASEKAGNSVSSPDVLIIVAS